MRGRCERHQLALGPSGCLLCRRAAAAGATVPEAAAPAERVAEPAPAEDGGEPVTASAAWQSAAPRRISVQLPGLVLLLPVVAGAFYFFVFFARTDPAAPAAAELRSARNARAEPAADGALDLVDTKRPTSARFETVVIEEPGETARRPPDSAPAEPAGPHPAAPRTQELNTRALAQARKQAEARELAEMRERVDVVVYSTTWCPACRSLRDYLVQRGIRATEYDIERDRTAKARQRELNPRGSVPTVDIDGQVLVGFSPRSIEAALDRAARARLQRL